MTFKLSSELTFPWPVKVIEPDPDKAGEKIERVFTAIFVMLDPDEAKASDETRSNILRQVKPDLKAKELRAIQEQLELHDRVALRRVLKGWKDDIQDEDGKPLPFNDATFSNVYRFPHIRAALLRAYREAITEEGGRLGN
jgi:hypothetical protein